MVGAYRSSIIGRSAADAGRSAFVHLRHLRNLRRDPFRARLDTSRVLDPTVALRDD